MANFLHGHVYSASLHRAIDPVCPQAILPTGVTLFPSGTLCATNITSRNLNDMWDCTELNGKHAGERLMSIYSF